MRVLLDECLPKRLKGTLAGHDVATVPEAGWAAIKNGVLRRLAERDFDVFITIDQNLPYQQDVSQFALAVVVLVARNNKLETLLPLMPSVQEALRDPQPGAIIHIGREEL